MKIVTGILFLFLLISLPLFSLETEDAARILLQAEDSFKRANELAEFNHEESIILYEKAAGLYRSIVDSINIVNGKLLYNTGNSFFKAGDIGRAILYYKRSLNYIPLDKNLLHNLEYVRGLRVDNIEVEEKNRVLKTILFWHFDLPFLFKSWIAASVFAGIWVLSLLMIQLRKSVLKSWITGLAVVFILLAVSIGADIISELRYKSGVITEHEVIARKGDSSSYNSSFEQPLHAGTEVTLLEERTGWLRVKLLNGEECWLPSDSVEFVN